jgi:hypothetical protein
MYDARISGQVYAVHESAAGVAAVVERDRDVWARDPCVAAIYAGLDEQGAELAAASVEAVKIMGRRDNQMSWLRDELGTVVNG